MIISNTGMNCVFKHKKVWTKLPQRQHGLREINEYVFSLGSNAAMH